MKGPGRRRRWALAGTLMTSALMAGLPAALRAQKATPRDAPVAAPTPTPQAAKEQAVTAQAQAMAQAQLDGEIERLVRQFVESQRKEQELARVLFKSADGDSTREFRVRVPPMPNDPTPEAARAGEPDPRRRMLLALQAASRDVMRTQAQLAALCERAPRPEGWLGLSFESDAHVVRRPDGTMGLHFVSYPTVAAIEPNSPAADAGVLRGDTLVMLGTVELRSQDVNFPALLKPGVRLPVTVRREGDAKTFVVKITRRPDSYGDRCSLLDRQMSAAMMSPVVGGLLPGEGRTIYLRGPMPAMAPRAPRAPRTPGTPTAATPAEAPLPPRPGEGGFVFAYSTGDWFGGAELRRLNRDLADLTGADEGVFVVSVTANSPADAAGLKGGDVIVRANDTNVTQPVELFRAVRESDDQSVQLTVVRKKKRQVLVVKLVHK